MLFLRATKSKAGAPQLSKEKVVFRSPTVTGASFAKAVHWNICKLSYPGRKSSDLVCFWEIKVSEVFPVSEPFSNFLLRMQVDHRLVLLDIHSSRD